MRPHWSVLALLGVALLLSVAVSPALAQDGNNTTTVVEDKDKATPGGDADPKTLEGDGWEVHPLSFKAHDTRPFPYATPGEGYTITVVKSDEVVLPFPNAGQPGIAAKYDGDYLMVDSNLDGKPDTTLKSAISASPMQLSLPDGRKIPYAIRADKGNSGTWAIQRNCYATGTVGKTKLVFIDDNSNGLWNDFGQDAVAIGNTTYASPLSDVIQAEGKLFRLKIDQAGNQFWTKPYEEAVGTLDMKKNFKANCDLAWCVLANGSTFLDLATAAKGGMPVPAGSWSLVIGELRRGKMTCRIRQGKFESVAVEAGGTAAPEWGMEVKLEFTYEVREGQVHIDSGNVNVVGHAGEQYHTFKPQAITPRVQVKDKASGKDVNRGTMCLS